ncbi:MAG: metalloregulator ArsR/SmtB family transcription factor [Saprospiraceae bacterium]|nr:metalloregulator ArsR/SmtB family transcription factor [Saprospiraceae bacterium]
MRKTKVTFQNEKLQVSAELMRALAHPLRLRILGFIDRHGTINVNKIYSTLKIEQSITSQHLRILRSANVLTAERDGKFIHYTINYPVVQKAAKAIKNFMAN